MGYSASWNLNVLFCKLGDVIGPIPRSRAQDRFLWKLFMKGRGKQDGVVTKARQKSGKKPDSISGCG